MSQTFTEDKAVQEVAEVYANDAISFAKDVFKIKLDWSDESIESIERILDVMHQDAQRNSPTEDQIMGFAKALGSYVGEVFRRNHGATWGIVRLGDEAFPGLQAGKMKGVFWPWGKARNRIVNGEEDNIVHYYKVLVREGSDKPFGGSPANGGKKSFWARLRGA